MDLLTPFRTLEAMSSSDGRRIYAQAVRRKLWAALGSLPGEMLVTCRLGPSLRMKISSKDQTLGTRIFATGEWEPAELAFLRKTLRAGMTVFDVGANIGVHTLVAAEAVGPTGRVHSFEPTRAFEQLQRNVELNGFEGRVNLNRCAVSDRTRMLDLMECKPGFEAYTSRGTPVESGVWTGRTLACPSTSLDCYAEERGIAHIHVLKLDVEGSEPLILQGCQRLLKNQAFDYILMEVNDVSLRNSGSSPEAVLGLVRGHGYSGWALSASGCLGSMPVSTAGLSFNVVMVSEKEINRDGLQRAGNREERAIQ